MAWGARLPLLLRLAWRDAVVAGDPHADNCLLCADGRVCLLGFGLLRDVDPDHVEGERGVMRAIADGDAKGSTTGCRAWRTCPIRTTSSPTRCSSTSPAGGWLLRRGPPARPEGRRSHRGAGLSAASPWSGRCAA